MYDCESCARYPCEGHIKECCKFHPDNKLTDLGSSPSHWWIKKKWQVVVTASMVEDLLHRNEVDIEHLTKDIKKYNEYIENRADRLEELLKQRAGLLKELEEMKKDEM